MVNFVYESLTKFFNVLSNLGYVKQKDVNKILTLVFIEELLDNDYEGYITEDDYNIIDKALYCLYGSTCLIPYPDYYKNKSNMYSNSLSDLVNRVNDVEQTLSDIITTGGDLSEPRYNDVLERLDNVNDNLAEIQDTKVLKGLEQSKIIDDIDLDDL